MRTIRPDCGGIYGTATYGQRYYAGHVQCGEAPPTPPPPVDQRKGYANRRKPKQEDLDDLIFIVMLWQNVRPIPTEITSARD